MVARGWTWARPFKHKEPAFRAVLDQCDRLLHEERDTFLFLASGDRAWELTATYAVEVACTALWESIGIRPDTVSGHWGHCSGAGIQSTFPGRRTEAGGVLDGTG